MPDLLTGARFSVSPQTLNILKSRKSILHADLFRLSAPPRWPSESEVAPVRDAKPGSYSAAAAASHLGLFRELVAMDGERRPDPERSARWSGADSLCSVHQNAQAAMVQHQPGHQLRENLAGKGYLIHGLIVRPYFHVVPSPERDRKALAQPCPQTARPRARVAGS